MLLSTTIARASLPLGTVRMDGSAEQFEQAVAPMTAFTAVCNATGVPAMSVPIEWTDDGLPIGMHFVARYGAEETLFSLATQLEQARPWRDSSAMMICDSQVHIWAANTPERPWPARAEPHRAPLGKEELLAEMDKAGVDRVMIVPPSWEGDRNDVAIDACQEPSRPVRDHGSLRSRRAGCPRDHQELEEAAGHAGHAPHLPHAGCASRCSRQVDWVWGEMETLGIPAMVLFHHEYMHLADKVAERYPSLGWYSIISA